MQGVRLLTHLKDVINMFRCVKEFASSPETRNELEVGVVQRRSPRRKDKSKINGNLVAFGESSMSICGK